MMIDFIRPIMKKAGKKIMEIYNSDDFEIQTKEDGSPVTRADKCSNNIIYEMLNNFSNFPVFSEEGDMNPNNYHKSNQIWLVDPLDGTKDFLSKNDEFTINIALIKDRTPVFGAIYLPAFNLCYWAEKDMGSYRDDVRICNKSTRCGTALVGTVSRFHETEKDRKFFIVNGIKDIRLFGSAIKFCRLAEGIVDVYPRFEASKQWDIAAGHIIATEAGCRVLDTVTEYEMIYPENKVNNNNFVAFRSNLILNFADLI